MSHLLIFEQPHLVERAAVRSEHWENHAFCVRASDSSTEFLLWLAFYIIRGKGGGNFLVDDISIDLSVIVVSDEPGSTTHDNLFDVTGARWSEWKAAHNLKVMSDRSSVTWVLSGRRHECRSSGWRIVGDAGPRATVDLTLVPITDAFHYGKHSFLSGFQSLANVSGTITLNGRTYTVSGIGQHEKLHTSRPIRVSRRRGSLDSPDSGHSWHCGGGEQLAISLDYNSPGSTEPSVHGAVVTNGAAHPISRDGTEVVETAWWVDPACRLSVPVEWRARVRCADGILDLSITARARAYYLWDYMRDGISVLHWFLAEAAAVWRPEDGTVLEERMRYALHTNRPFL